MSCVDLTLASRIGEKQKIKTQAKKLLRFSIPDPLPLPKSSTPPPPPLTHAFYIIKKSILISSCFIPQSLKSMQAAEMKLYSHTKLVKSENTENHLQDNETKTYQKL